MTFLLRCDASGLPLSWASVQTGAGWYASGRVLWDYGGIAARLLGGRNALTGLQSVLDLRAIVAVSGRSRSAVDHVPKLANRQLFRRDGHLCLYCGQSFAQDQLTRDHVIPSSRGGADSWENCVTACRRCNQRKADRTPEEAGMPLLAVPHRPKRAQWLILANRKIIADQMDFLRARTPQGRAGVTVKRPRWNRA